MEIKRPYVPVAGGYKIRIPNNPGLSLVPFRTRQVAFEMFAPGGGGYGGRYGDGGGGGSHVCVVFTIPASGTYDFTFNGGQRGDGGSPGFIGADGTDIEIDWGNWNMVAYGGLATGTGGTGGEVPAVGGYITSKIIKKGGNGGVPPGTNFTIEGIVYSLGGGGGQAARGYSTVRAMPNGNIVLLGTPFDGLNAPDTGRGAGQISVAGRGGDGGGLYFNSKSSGNAGYADAFTGSPFGGGGGGGGSANGTVGYGANGGGGRIIVTYDWTKEPPEDEVKVQRQRHADAYDNVRAFVSRETLNDGSSTTDFMEYGFPVQNSLMIFVPVLSRFSLGGRTAAGAADQATAGGARLVRTINASFKTRELVLTPGP